MAPTNHQSPRALPDLLLYPEGVRYLNDLLAFKQSRNRRYSLRSFAKALGLPVSTLSAILNGTRKLLPANAALIAERLAFSAVEQHYFVLLAETELMRGEKNEAKLQAKLNEAAWLIRASRGEGVRALDFVPEWYHLALVEWASRTQEISCRDLREFGLRIGLAEAQVDSAIAMLLDKKILSVTSSGALSRQTDRILLTSDVSNPVFRRMHEAITERALVALRTQSPGQRYSVTEFITLDSEGFRKLKELTNQYLDQAQYESNRVKNADRLYCISLHAFRMEESK